MSLPPRPEPTSHPNGRVILDVSLLKSLRQARGWSQEALADLCFQRHLPVSIASVKRAEAGNAVLYRTARHLAMMYEVKVDALVQRAQPAPHPGPAPMSDSATPAMAMDETLRYVVQLHVELAAPPDADDGTLAVIGSVSGRFGGRIDFVADQAVTCVYGVPEAFDSDVERAGKAAAELARALPRHTVRGLALRLVRWRDGEVGMDAAPFPDLWSGAATATAPPPIHVASNLAPRLEARFDLQPAVNDVPGYLGLGPFIDERSAPRIGIVGRTTEVRQFEAVLDAACDVGGGQLVYLRGAAGVGKSRLAQAYAGLARARGFRCHHAQVQDIGTDSWRAPLEQLARSLFGIGEGAPSPAEDMIDGAIARLHLPADWSLFYRAIAGARLPPDQASVFAAMSHPVRERGLASALGTLILRLAQCGPLLLTIEDVHWGRSPLFEALGALLPLAREAPVLWVLTSRFEQDPLEASLRPHLFDLPAAVLDLAPMAPRDALALAAQHVDLDEGYRRRCVERAQGNALFLTQLLANPDTELPDSLKHLMQSRLDALPHRHRRALHMAAAIGNRFELDVLREALGDPDYEPEPAGRNLLIRRTAPGSYAFVHDLVMHCIYESIKPERLRQLHRSLAASYRRRDLALSARHLYLADDPQAFDVMLLAIRATLADHRYQDALNLIERCAGADPHRAAGFALTLLGAQASAGLGHTAQARERYQHALALASRPDEHIEAVVGLAATLNLLDELDQEERLIDETLPLARSTDALGALGRLFYLKGNIYFPRGDHGACRRFHEEAMYYARLAGAAETEALALSGLGDACYAQGRMAHAHDMFEQCIAMCDEHGLVSIEASNRSARGSTRIYLGRSAEAVSDALDAADIAHKVGNRRAEVFARMTAGWALCAMGQLDAAHEQVSVGLTITRAIGAARFEPLLMESLARIAWARGQHDKAERTIVAAAELVERGRLQRYLGAWVLGTLALFSSETGVRKKALLRGAACLTRDCLAHNAYRFHVSAAEVAMLEGDPVTADFHAEQLERYAEAAPSAWLTHHARLIRALAARGAAPPADSRSQLRRLAAEGERFGFNYTMPRLHDSLSLP